MRKFWNRWNQVVLDAIWLILLTILGIFNIATATNDNLYIWLLGINFGIVSANLIASIANARK